jgi:glycogen operon protein
MSPPRTESGLPLPLGAQFRDGGVNFALFSRHATQVWLELFDAPDDDTPTHAYELEPDLHRTGDIWHIWIDDIQPGQLYGYRADGPYAPHDGHRFNANKLLIDPYARAITHEEAWDFHQARGYDPLSPQRDLSISEVDNTGDAPKCVVTDKQVVRRRERLLRRPWSETIIYEMHVRGFTRHESSGVDHPGTFRGVIEKIPYLKDLGVTAVELMPVQEFNEEELARVNPMTGEPLRNYWGYNPVAFMAPNGTFCSTGTQGEQVDEFKEMVRALHDAGIEVILDVVFNHTAESDELGPTVCWRGLDNQIYYILGDDPRFYQDYTGTGNTIKADHPIVRELILDALRYWTVEMGVDGFRFDLASVLGRDEDGSLHADPPLLERIAEDPVLREVKMIAEAWDAAGAYQVGSFHERRWSEWNGQFRDDVRRFWRGDAGMLGAFASRLGGSSDLYEGSSKGPECSINYVTAHDGFTLHDLVSYSRKHNEANGEFNRDGTDQNFSANYGEEGATDDDAIKTVRRRQIKNFILTLFVARGVPMLLGGDEFRRTQRGNNNAYCQDNIISWFDWSRLDTHSDIHRFVKGMIRFRQAHAVLREEEFYSSRQVHWFNPGGVEPDWDDPSARRLGMHVRNEEGPDFCFLFNADTEATPFVLPVPPDGQAWHRKADTSAASPKDLLDDGDEHPLDDQQHYEVHGRSSVILMAK